MGSLESEFHEEMINIYKRAKKECGYNARLFLQTVIDKGGVVAAKHWLSTEIPQDGFFKLYDLNRLDLTMERLVLLKKYKSLFTEEELDSARKRLAEVKYVVDD